MLSIVYKYLQYLAPRTHHQLQLLQHYSTFTLTSEMSGKKPTPPEKKPGALKVVTQATSGPSSDLLTPSMAAYASFSPQGGKKAADSSSTKSTKPVSTASPGNRVGATAGPLGDQPAYTPVEMRATSGPLSAGPARTPTDGKRSAFLASDTISSKVEMRATSGPIKHLYARPAPAPPKASGSSSGGNKSKDSKYDKV